MIAEKTSKWGLESFAVYLAAFIPLTLLSDSSLLYFASRIEQTCIAGLLRPLETSVF